MSFCSSNVLLSRGKMRRKINQNKKHLEILIAESFLQRPGKSPYSTQVD
jgi:hypothetical protein